MELKPLSEMEIDVVELLNIIRKLATESPDAVYDLGDDTKTCYYSKGECGKGIGCIIGQALLKMGVDVELLDQIPSLGGIMNIRQIINRHPYSFVNAPDYRWIHWIHQIQIEQDLKHTWIYALREADHKHTGDY